MVKLELGFALGVVYLAALWFFLDRLNVPVVVVTLPFWFWLALKFGGLYGLALFLVWYVPDVQAWLLDQVERIREEEQL